MRRNKLSAKFAEQLAATLPLEKYLKKLDVSGNFISEASLLDVI